MRNLLAFLAVFAVSANGFSAEFEGSVTTPTAYVFRGYTQVNDHPMVQTDLTVSQSFDVGSFSLEPHAGVWSNVVDADVLNEIDLSAGLDISLGKFDVDLLYTLYTSPDGDFDSLSEIGITLSHDDFANPHISLFRELTARGGTAFEAGVDASIEFKGFTLDFPITVGAGANSYYTDSKGRSATLGYGAVGAGIKLPINEKFSVRFGLDYYRFIADSTRDDGNGLVVGSIALKFEF